MRGIPPTRATGRGGIVPPMSLQLLTLHLDGITAADYVAHVCDPEPSSPALRWVALRVHDGVGDVVEAAVSWDGEHPPAERAAMLAGLPITADVIAVEAAPDNVIELRCRDCPELRALAIAA